VEVRPSSASSWNNLGHAWSRTGDQERAVACFKEAIRLEEEQAAYYLNRALAYARLGYTEEVISDLRHAVKLNPLLCDILTTLKPLEALAEDPRFQDLIGRFPHP
jgi:tetratricopeptide (TPR) repeat protein